MLCDICLKLIVQLDWLLSLPQSDNIPVHQNLPHHQTVDSIVHAVEVVGCVICTRAASEAPGLVDRELEEWLRSQGDRSDLRYNALVNLSTWQRNGEISLRLMSSSYGGVPAFRLRSFDDSIEVALKQDWGSLSSYTGDVEVLDRARHWLDRCRATHEKCRYYSHAKTVYPARLLDLEPDGYDDGLYFRLIEGEAMRDVSGGYITLSHRWGPRDKHPPRLNAASYASLIQGWPIQRLSGTYQEAITVVKKLGIRYIWVDSLCILQDEQLDILIEALKMATVYGNAVCNISALDARQDGLFNFRDAVTVSPLSHIVSKMDQPELQRSYAIGDHRLWETSIFDAPLSQRGWILQEQLLARRTLFFGHEQLLWSCISGAWCETYPMEDGVWDDSDFKLGQRHLESVRLYCAAANHALSRGSHRSLTNAIDQYQKRDFQMAWRHVVQEYVPRQLTEPGDKLLAIAGIVSSFTKTQDDECIAGHWRSSFPFNLLWHVSIEKPPKQDQPNCSADDVQPRSTRCVPTWSWASQDGHLIIPGELDRRYCAPIAKILSIERQSHVLAGNGIRTEVVGALTLVAPQLPLLKVKSEDKIRWEFKASASMPALPSPDPLGENVETYFEAPNSATLTGPLVAVFVSYEVHVSQRQPHSTQSFAVAVTDKILIRCEGLILQCSPSDQHGRWLRYKRIGHFKFGEILMDSSESRFMPANWKFHLNVEERDGMLYTKAPDFDDGELMHTIEIV